MKMDALSVYRTYQAMKLHFNTKSYDFVKYGGKLKSVTSAGFEKRRDKTFYYRLSNKYPALELVDFLIANVSRDPKIYVSDLLSDEARMIYKDYKKIMSSPLTYFEDDLLKLFLPYDNPIDSLSVVNGQLPKVITEMIGGRFSIISFCVLLEALPIDYVKVLDESNILMWETLKLRIQKTSSFLNVNKQDARKILQKIMKEYEESA